MINQAHERYFRSALKAVADSHPRDLITRALVEAQEDGATVSAEELADLLESASADSPFLAALGMQVHKWDAADAAAGPWTEGTKPSTVERRTVVCHRLGISERGEAALLHKRPIFHNETVVITAPWDPWYTQQRAVDHEFYWPRYRDYLLNVRGWESSNVTSLDLATTQVVERLTDPTRAEAHGARGLVVGYVQSGKTANFTGVIAKAVDAGYRLVIVMTGTIELLRSQTQRRIDMELVGRQNILGDIPDDAARALDIDYVDDPAWLAGQFLDLRDPPNSEIVRLTRHKTDYKGLGAQFKALKMERAVPALPLYRPENLFKAQTRLAIVKKNATRLKQLVQDIKANKSAFAEIPVLIIDDESDEASVNTVDPEKVKKAQAEGRQIQERRAINQAISELLQLMPRAQYVGYTATPFANVFVDPSDPLTIFPKDFLVSLRRPPAYMGVEDFHDFDLDPDAPRTVENSNEKAFVRDLVATDDESRIQAQELRRAIDLFVLAGAVKLYRTKRAGLTFRHHTMLVHSAVQMASHKELAQSVRDSWLESAYSSAKGRARLRALYESDVLPVSRSRVEADVPVAPPFADLETFIPEAIQRIGADGNNPVLVINSDKEIEQQILDFDKNDVWRILVGGAKLSRGFTVEGLTVTYFRRATNMSASLTQMGRWFGFRQGYRDLVRLFIARKASFGGTTVDLYEAFAAIAVDEAQFRRELEKYAEWEEGRPRVIPSQIPPLVSQTLPWLKPVAKNKMFNARLVEQATREFKPTGYPNTLAGLKGNLDRWRSILAAANTVVDLPLSATTTYQAYVGVGTASDVVAAIGASNYLPLFKERVVAPATTFLRRLIDSGDLDDFLLFVPQPGTRSVEIHGVGARRAVERDRRAERGGLFGEVTDPKHRPAAAGFLDGSPGPQLQPFVSPTRGVLMLYLVTERDPHHDADPQARPAVAQGDPERGLVLAWSALVPVDAFEKHSRVIRFQVINKVQEDLPIVDVPPRSAHAIG